MKKPLAQLFFGMAALGIASAAHGLTIIPTFDISITTNTNSAAIMSAINFSIQALQSNLTDNSTVKILFVSDESVGLGQSATWDAPYSYSNYLAALRGRATSANDTNALSRIPVSATDPLVGNDQIVLKLPLARLMGLDSGYGPDGYDSTISCKMSLMNFTRPPGDPNKYDLVGTLEHEMNEVLGFPSNLKRGYPDGPISPIDLFRYTTNLARTWTTNGDNAYFSVDGTNLLARFNQDPDGDYHDWWSANGLWSPPGTTPHEQVQDAFGGPGTTQDEGSNELTALDVIGYTLAGSATSPFLKIVKSGANQFTLSWPGNFSNFVLQEETNLTSSNWVPSVSGSSNPAVVVSTATQKYYRLQQQSVSILAVPAQIAAVQVSTNSSLRLSVHVYAPHNP